MYRASTFKQALFLQTHSNNNAYCYFIHLSTFCEFKLCEKKMIFSSPHPRHRQMVKPISRMRFSGLTRYSAVRSFERLGRAMIVNTSRINWWQRRLSRCLCKQSCSHSRSVRCFSRFAFYLTARVSLTCLSDAIYDLPLSIFLGISLVIFLARRERNLLSFPSLSTIFNFRRSFL